MTALPNRRWTIVPLAAALGAIAIVAPTVAQDRAAARAALIARAKALELPTPYVPPPGDPLEHHAAGYAKIMCSAVFITGLEPGFAAENVGGFTSPFGERAKVGTPVVDREARAVHITLPNGVTRTAVQAGSQGCLTLPCVAWIVCGGRGSETGDYVAS